MRGGNLLGTELPDKVGEGSLEKGQKKGISIPVIVKRPRGK